MPKCMFLSLFVWLQLMINLFSLSFLFFNTRKTVEGRNFTFCTDNHRLYILISVKKKHFYLLWISDNLKKSKFS